MSSAVAPEPQQQQTKNNTFALELKASITFSSRQQQDTVDLNDDLPQPYPRGDWHDDAYYDEFDPYDRVVIGRGFGGGGVSGGARGGGKDNITKSAARRNKHTSCYSAKHIRATVGR